MSNYEFSYDAESGVVTATVVVDVKTSFNDETKRAGVAARKAGVEPPTGSEVPHKVSFSVQNTIEDLIEAATKPAVIRVQRGIKAEYPDEVAFDKAIRDATIESDLISEGRKAVDAFTAAKRNVSKLNAEEKAALLAMLADDEADEA